MPEDNVHETQAAEQPESDLNWLTPENTEVFRAGDGARIDCRLNGKDFYRGIHAKLMFPVRHPNEFISLCYSDKKGRVQEIGVIEKIADFPRAAQRLIRSELRKHYYEQVIKRVYHIESGHGLLFFDVETQRGREQFVMPWRTANTEDYGKRGKVLHESCGNRYIVPDVNKLSPADKRRFTRHVYW